MDVSFRTGRPLEGDPWCCDEHDDIESALDALDAQLDADDLAALVFAQPCPEGLSLPRLWRRVLGHLTQRDFDRPLEVWAPSATVIDHLVRYLPVDARPFTQHQRPGGLVLHATVGDLANANADAIVNASNTRLVLGGGVSGALAERFGDELQSGMRAHGTIADGQTVVTSCPTGSGCKYVLHCASAEGSEATIRACIDSVLERAVQLECSTVITPALGTGTGMLPVSTFARLVWKATRSIEASLRLETWCWTQSDFKELQATWTQLDNP
ncbi:MAG: macro domain-containing protein [Myxococcota bacterium]